MRLPRRTLAACGHPRGVLAATFVWTVLTGFLAVPLLADPVLFKDVMASAAAGGDRALRQAIDGAEMNAEGWSMGSAEANATGIKAWSQGKNPEKRHSAIFIPAAPVDANRFEISLYFLSGTRDRAMAHFALFATTDPIPTPDGSWEPLDVERFSATSTTLEQISANQLWAVERPRSFALTSNDPIYSVTSRWRGGPVTGFRLDAIPVSRPDDDAMRMSWNARGDFVLTEFKVDALHETNTNIAHKARVTASHLLSGNLSPGVLTDGRPSTYATPWEPGLGEVFFFEIDLGQIVGIDHIGLRGRGDNSNLDRFSKLTLRVYEADPATGTMPTWEAHHRSDGSHPANGALDQIWSTAGTGTCRGRYLRISTTSAVPFSPQLAEVEVYPVRTPELVTASADGTRIPHSRQLVVPPHTRHLTMDLAVPGSTAKEAPFRWRLAGYEDAWQPGNALAFNFPCPGAGRYRFEAQFLHSDGQYDSTVFTLPVEVTTPFTQRPAFYLIMIASCVAVGALLMWRRNRRRLAHLESENALSMERRRIARDMHDKVGALLSQLSVRQDTFARDHALRGTAESDLLELSRCTRQAVRSLNEVVWMINPKHDTLESLADYMINYADHYLSPVEIRCIFDAADVWPACDVRSHVRHELVMAFKEALQNVVKHAGATEVQITIGVQDSNFMVVVADNGIGLPAVPGPRRGDGLENMKNRLASLGGSCEFRTRSGGGTQVVFRMPLPGNKLASPTP